MLVPKRKTQHVICSTLLPTTHFKGGGDFLRKKFLYGFFFFFFFALYNITYETLYFTGKNVRSRRLSTKFGVTNLANQGNDIVYFPDILSFDKSLCKFQKIKT